MKKYINNILLLGLLVVFVASCTPDQDVAPIDDPSDRPAVTITPQGDYSTLSEGDVLVYDIVVDKYVTNAVSFSVVLGDDSEVGASDFSVSGGSLQPYTDSTQISIALSADYFPEPDELFSFRITFEEDLAWGFQMSPLSDDEATSKALTNVHADDELGIGLSWEMMSDDWDAYVVAKTDTTYADGSETGSVETLALAEDSADGEYYVTAYPYEVENDVTNFTLVFNRQDGSLEEMTTTIDLSDETAYSEFDGSVIVATIVKSGTSFSITTP